MTREQMPLSDYFEEMARGMRLASEGRRDEALVHLESGLALARDHAPAKHLATVARNAGLFVKHQGDLHRALELFSEALASAPSDLHLHAELAELHERVGDETRSKYHWQAFARMAEESGDADAAELLAVYRARGSIEE